MKYKKTGIICAMESEADQIRGQMKELTEKTVAGQRFFSGRIGEKDVVLTVCGIGKVFAAMGAQTMILEFAPDAILNSGVAGSLSRDLRILDVAISEDFVQHDMDTTPLGDPPGLISGINKVFFPADRDLIESLRKAAEKQKINTLTGRIASGDQFIARPEQKERIIREFAPIACEMEGAAIAQVAYVNGVPFCAIRAVSDAVDGKNEIDFAAFSAAAADQSARLLLTCLEE